MAVLEKELVMSETRDWQVMRDMSARLLTEHTGENVVTWNRRIEKGHFSDEASLRALLTLCVNNA